jgi:acetylornithine/succinyldiaminopimelate/putrescine aminotransferase
MAADRGAAEGDKVKKSTLRLASLFGTGGRGMMAAARAAQEYLGAADAGELLGRVGQTIPGLPRAEHLDKRFIQASYRGDLSQPPDDLLAGAGVFYVTEQGKLVLDGTAGHYQMTWGYNHPDLIALVREALDAGIVWDDHSNIPGNAVKRLAGRLVEAANGPESAGPELLEDPKALNTVLLGVCTGSVAVNAALKIALKHHEVVRPGTEPVLISLEGNYHGTDFLAQRLRGMWKEFFHGIKFIEIPPNDITALRKAFAMHRGRVAAMFCELVMMNREAILLDEDFVGEARIRCDEADACLVIDEIQSGFWYPRCFLYHQYGILPDILVVGKGMTAGLHPLSAIVYNRRLDRLAQYDAISTNGNAPLAAVAGLGCMSLIESQGEQIADLNRYYFDRLQELPAADPQRVAAIHGHGLLAGVKFRKVEDAIEVHRRLLERGLWTRVHAYHEGHSTILTKLALAADRRVADFVVDAFHETLRETNHA